MNTDQMLSKIDLYIYDLMTVYLIEKFPELKSKHLSYDHEDGIYRFMYHFSNLVIKEINNEEVPLIRTQAIDFINDLAKSNNLEVINILKVGILEILYSTKSVREKVRSLLSNECLVYFNHYSEYYK